MLLCVVRDGLGDSCGAWNMKGRSCVLDGRISDIFSGTTKLSGVLYSASSPDCTEGRTGIKEAS